jgi:hypothetical protein
VASAEPRRISTLELFHPAGTAPRVLVLGGRCPPAVVDGPSRVGEAGPADIVVVAPTVEQCRAAGWLARAARSAADALDDDGVGFVLAPLPWRFRLLRAVREQHLVLGPAILHLPDLASSRYLVAAGRTAARYATACLIPRSSWRGRVASVAARTPGGTRLVAQAGLASVVVRRRTAAPLFRWLVEAAGEAPPERVVITRTWRPQGGTFTVSVIDDGGARPRFVARVGTAPPAARESLGEERALATFAASAQAAGAAVPRPLASSQLDGLPVLVETGVAGRVAATTVSERPRDVPVVLDRVLAWLLRWNRATANAATLTPAVLAQEVLAAARLVARALPSGAAYLDVLERLCREVAGIPVTLAAAHDDLTMTNVLLQRDGSIGVVDWDTARADALPLGDFFYAVVDAYAASERYVDRARAFADCFASAGRHARAVGAHQALFERALDVTPGVLAVSFHACWVHHAANELERGEDGPFVGIVRQLAARPERFAPSLVGRR